MPLAERPDGAVAGAVVDDDRLMRERLRGKRVEQPLEPLGAERRHDTTVTLRGSLDRARASTTIEPPRPAMPAASSSPSATGTSSGPAIAVSTRSRAIVPRSTPAEVALDQAEGEVALAGETVEQRLPHPEWILLDQQVANAHDPQAGALEQRERGPPG